MIKYFRRYAAMLLSLILGLSAHFMRKGDISRALNISRWNDWKRNIFAFQMDAFHFDIEMRLWYFDSF